MQISKINNQQNFQGRFFIQGKLRPQLRDKFRPYEESIHNLIKQKDFDLFARESSTHSMLFSTDKNFRTWFGVPKKEKGYEKAATEAIKAKEEEILAFRKYITDEDRAFIRSKLYVTTQIFDV